MPGRRVEAATLTSMLFMVIERFKNGDPKPIGQRFRREGRMLPEGAFIKRVGLIPQTPVVFK